MHPHERFLFDLQGYLRIPDAIDARRLAELNGLCDERLRDIPADKPTHRFGGLLDWGPPMRAMIDHAPLLPYVEELCGARFRLDHVYLDVIRAGLSPIGASLHGGGTPFDPAMYYQFRDGRMHNALIVVAYNLADVGPDDGGFACVPGTHKANYPFPPEWQDLRDPHPCVARVTGPAGTAIVFTEALTHGPLPWTGRHERRTLFFKYNVHCCGWSAGTFDHGKWDDLSDRQRAILEGPNARYEGRPTAPAAAKR